MSKAKDNEDLGASTKTKKKTKKKTGGEEAKGGGGGGQIVGGGQFIGSESSNSNRDASLLPPPPPPDNVQLDNSATDNSFLYSADETYNAPKKKKNKKTRAKIQTSKEDDEDDNNRERLNISEVSGSFDGFRESDWTEEEEEEEAGEADGQRDSLRRMGERLDMVSEGNAGVAVPSSSSAFVDGGTDKGKKKKKKKEKSAVDDGDGKAKVSLDKFGKLFRKLKRGNETNEANDDDAEKATLTAFTTTTKNSAGRESEETTTIHNPTARGTPSGHRLTAQPRYAVGGGGEDGQGMGEKERVMRKRQRRISNRKICESVLVTVVLVLGFVLGIVLTALSSMGLVFQIVGPTILGLSAFGLVGKVFVTVFWQEDPYLWTKRKFKRVASRHQRNQKTTKAPPASSSAAAASAAAAAAASAAAVELHTISSGQRSPQEQGLSFSIRISDDNSQF